MQSGSAETVLQKLQQELAAAALRDQQVRSYDPGGDVFSHLSLPTACPPPLGERAQLSRRALGHIEQRYGSRATRYGRILMDLVYGSHAWLLFGEPPDLDPRLPRTYEIAGCEPLLRAMRASGELDEREALLREREHTFMIASSRVGLSSQDRQQAYDDAFSRYHLGVAEIAARYLAHYEHLRNHASAWAPPLLTSLVRSRPMLSPPLMNLLFTACHSGKEGFTKESIGSDEAFKLARGDNAIYVVAASDSQDCARGSSTARVDIELLDEMTWDIATIAVSAFSVRTGGVDAFASFPLLLDDYFLWRNVDPRKRTAQAREELNARIQLLTSDRLRLVSSNQLWLRDPVSGRRRRTPVVTEGSLLTKHSVIRTGRTWSSGSKAAVQGYVVSLSDWAYKLVEERAMLGICFKRLAEYDIRRQSWERRIGWYLAFQMNNQGSKMEFADICRDGRTRTTVRSQHPIRMRTVLNNSCVEWTQMAPTNPGKVIRQWCEALETLRQDGVIGEYSCLDGEIDGSNLPVRGRLEQMLEYRFRFIPGRSMVKHLRSKKDAAIKSGSTKVGSKSSCPA